MSSRLLSPAASAGDEALFHIDAPTGEPPEAFVLDTKGDELFTSAADLPPPPSLAFLNHNEEAPPHEAEERQRLVLPDNARVTKDVVENDAATEDDGDRYYDSAAEGEEEADEKPALRCAACGEEGHMMRKCPHKRCLTCGAVDEHYTRECPMGIVCHKCGLTGHRIRDCTYRGPRRNLCAQCQSAHHAATACPTLWRIYAYLDNEEFAEEREVLFAELEGVDHEERAMPPPEWDPATRWCYNCAAKGNHWGDDCPEPRRAQQGDWTIWSEVGSRTGPFAHSLPPPPKLVQSMYQDDTSVGLRDVDLIMSDYFARKRPRSGPAAAPRDTREHEKKRSLLDRMGPGKKERVPYSATQKDRRRPDGNRRSRWDQDRPPDSLASRMDLDRPTGPGVRDPVLAGGGGLDYGADDPDDWFEKRARQQKDVKKKPQNTESKNGNAGPARKHQAPPAASRPSKDTSHPDPANRQPTRPPQFGQNEPFSFTFGKGNTSTSASNTSTPLSDVGDNSRTRQERRKERKRLRKQTKAAEAQKDQTQAVGKIPTDPRKANAQAPKSEGAGNRTERKLSGSRSGQPTQPSAFPIKTQPPTSTAQPKKRSRAPISPHAPQYHGSLAD